MTSTKFEGILVLIWHYQVDHTRGVLLKGKGFKPEEVAIFRDINIHQTILAAIRLENIRVRFLTDLTLELLP